jgi:hypothetical protein
MSAKLASLRQFALAMVVAAGLAAAWCVLVAWLVGMAQTAALRSSLYEQPYFKLDGEVVVVRYPNGIQSGYQETVDLNGQVSRANTSQLLANSYPLYRAGDAALLAADWRSRLAGVNDGGTPATYWYLVHDGHTNGSAYGVGYHSLTRRIVGYFGRQGFTATKPPRSDWFTVEGRHGLSVATTGAVNAEPSWSTERALHLLANGKLWSIDPRKRQVRALADAPPGAAIGWIWDLRKVDPEKQPQNLAVQSTGWAPRMLGIRADDRLILVELENGQPRSILLPPEVRDRVLAGCELADGKLSLIAFGTTTFRQAQEAIRIDPEGKIVKRQAIPLSGGGNELFGEANMGWFVLAAAPFAAAQAPVAVLYPQELVRTGQYDSYAAALSPSLARLWPCVVGSLLIGVFSAIAAYRRQKRYALPGAIGWAIFAFLFGIPGWIAYRFHRTWPVVEACPECTQPAPRDRESCVECGATFPPPELKGLEVFA